MLPCFSHCHFHFRDFTIDAAAIFTPPPLFSSACRHYFHDFHDAGMIAFADAALPRLQHARVWRAFDFARAKRKLMRCREAPYAMRAIDTDDAIIYAALFHVARAPLFASFGFRQAPPFSRHYAASRR
jgi:hypothetical protein